MRAAIRVDLALVAAHRVCCRPCRSSSGTRNRQVRLVLFQVDWLPAVPGRCCGCSSPLRCKRRWRARSQNRPSPGRSGGFVKAGPGCRAADPSLNPASSEVGSILRALRMVARASSYFALPALNLGDVNQRLERSSGSASASSLYCFSASSSWSLLSSACASASSGLQVARLHIFRALIGGDRVLGLLQSGRRARPA
jgi:hypothetical protein